MRLINEVKMSKKTRKTKKETKATAKDAKKNVQEVNTSVAQVNLKKNWGIVDYFNNASDAAKGLINRIFELKELTSDLEKDLSSGFINGIDRAKPSEEHKKQIMDAFAEYKNHQKFQFLKSKIFLEIGKYKGKKIIENKINFRQKKI